jgi:hypothetical protein
MRVAVIIHHGRRNPRTVMHLHKEDTVNTHRRTKTKRILVEPERKLLQIPAEVRQYSHRGKIVAEV